MRASVLIAILALGVSLPAQELSSSARLQTGSVPALPALAVGGGEVMLEVAVDAQGRVGDVKPLRTTPPFTELLTQAVRDWRFRPAADGESKVLVAGVFRPPAINLPTLGEPAREGAPPSDETAFPLKTALPPFPPQANRSGVVLLEARVNRSGEVADVRVVHSAPPFDDAARSALRDWIFRPARMGGAAADSLVYVVVGFAAPVSGGALPIAVK